MRIIGCDLHARQQTLAMLDTTTGEVVKMTLAHEGNNVREFYSTLPRPVRVGIEATGSMVWFVNLMEDLGIECQVGNPAKIRAAEPRKQKHDRRDADQPTYLGKFIVPPAGLFCSLLHRIMGVDELRD